MRYKDIPSNQRLPEPPESGWAIFHTICGWLSMVIASLLLVMTFADRWTWAEIQYFIVIMITSGIGNFFFAYCIQTFSNTAHYAEMTAKKITVSNLLLCEMMGKQIESADIEVDPKKDEPPQPMPMDYH